MKEGEEEMRFPCFSRSGLRPPPAHGRRTGSRVRPQNRRTPTKRVFGLEIRVSFLNDYRRKNPQSRPDFWEKANKYYFDIFRQNPEPFFAWNKKIPPILKPDRLSFVTYSPHPDKGRANRKWDWGLDRDFTLSALKISNERPVPDPHRSF